MQILITNDDGVYAPGIRALAAALQPAHAVTIVAPDRERSAASHSLTLDRPLSVKEVALNGLESSKVYAVNGTPVDCVRLGVSVLAPETQLLLSGINNGANLGGDISYSGTVHAALEGAVCGLPAMALSLRIPPDRQKRSDPEEFVAAAELAAQLLKQLPELPPQNLIYNINFPASKLRAGHHCLKVCPQGESVYDSVFQRNDDPFGREYYWICAVANETDYNEKNQTDVFWSDRNFVTLTPLRWNMTAYDDLVQTEETLRAVSFSCEATDQS